KQPLATTAQHLSRLISRWPKDLVRPEAVAVPTYLQSRLQAQAQSQSQSRAQDGGGAKFSKQNLNALYSLLDNRYQRRYRLPDALRYPASQPGHYDALMAEFRDAPNRDFWGRLKKRVAGPRPRRTPWLLLLASLPARPTRRERLRCGEYWQEGSG
ncbi:hypothetical protein KEM52_001662, partial [Ascosphaera acerosa]